MSAQLAYLLSSPFNAPLELEINPFDSEINVSWPVTGEPIVSPKDAAAPSFTQRLRRERTAVLLLNFVALSRRRQALLALFE